MRVGMCVIAGVLVTGVLAGCQSVPPGTGGTRPYKETSAEKRAIQQMNAQYGAPNYINAWSCRSEREAMHDLMMQLSVNVDVESLSLSSRKDLNVHYRTKSGMSLASMESLKGLVFRKAGNCTFVAINPKNAHDYYTDLAKEHEKEVSRLFAQLDQNSSALVRFRSARRLVKILQELRTDHDAMHLFGAHPKKLDIGGARLRKLQEALSVRIVARAGSGYGGVQSMVENPAMESIVANYMTKKGFNVTGAMADPAFTVRIGVKREILPYSPSDGHIKMLLVVDGRIVDNKDGRTIKEKELSGKMNTPDFGTVDSIMPPNDAVKSIIDALVDGVEESSSDPVLRSTSF